jgi:hypothetical protein
MINIRMLSLTKKISSFLLTSGPNKYFIFDSNPQTNFGGNDEEEKMQKVLKSFESNESDLTPEKMV